MSQLKRIPSGGPHAMLSDEHYDIWARENNELFDKLPQSVRDAIKECGIDMDHGKLLRCVAIGIPETSIIAEIYKRHREAKDGAPKWRI